LGVRRVQRVGRSTYTVSLPQEWVRSKNLTPKTEVDVNVQHDGSLRINTLESMDNSKEPREITVSAMEADPGYIIRKALAAYIANYDIIHLDLSKFIPEAGGKEKIKKVIKTKMAGGEIIEESVARITVQILLKPYEFPLEKILLRMAIMAKDMMADVGRGMVERDPNILKDVIERDEDVDKLYFMASRWLASIVSDQGSLQDYGIKHIKDCLEYRLAFRNMERVSDHVERISRHYITVLGSVGTDVAGALASGLEMSMNVFVRAVNCLQSGSLQEANKAIHDARKAAAQAEELIHRVIDKETDKKMIGAMIIITDSIKRIADYGIGIAEIAFNMHVE